MANGPSITFKVKLRNVTSQETTLKFMNDIGPFICVLSLAAHCSKIALRITLEKTAPRETENNDYAKFGGDKQKALWYVMVFSGVVNCILCSKYINLQTGQPICTASLPYTKNPITIHLSAPLSLVSESCPCVIHSGGTREGVRFPLFLDKTGARKRDRVQHLPVQTACVTVIFKTLN